MARQVTETRIIDDADRPVADPSPATILERIIYMLGGVLIVLLAIRFLLSLLGANRENGFADFIYSVTYPFVAPFFGLFNYDMQYGVARFEIETLVAIVVYAAIIALLARLASLGRPRREV